MALWYYCVIVALCYYLIALCYFLSCNFFLPFNLQGFKDLHGSLYSRFLHLNSSGNVGDMSELWKLSICLFLLCLDEDVLVFGFQDTFTDELLSDGNGHVVGHTQVGQVVQEPAHTCGVNTKRLQPAGEPASTHMLTLTWALGSCGPD